MRGCSTSTPRLEESLAGVTCEHKFLIGDDEDLYAAEGAEPAPWAHDEGATATINYTSGTTARPKGVQITHRNIWVNALTFGLHAQISDRDVYLHTLPQFHANGWGMPFAMTGIGARHVILRKVDGAEILRRVRDHGVTVMCAAPAVAAAVLEAAQTWEGEIPGRDKVRIIMAGAPPPTKTVIRVQEEPGLGVHPDLRPHRDLAAAHLQPHPRRVGRPARRGARAQARPGRARPRSACRLKIDESEEGAGEVLARSNVVLEGYWEQPEESAAALADDWFHTGDGGYLGEDGYLTIADRKKDVIITGGENVTSIEVEDTLFSHPAVAEVAVIGVPSEKWGETIKALVVLTGDAQAGPEMETEPDPLVQGPAGGLQGADVGGVPRRAWPARRPASLQKFKAARALLGGVHPPGELIRGHQAGRPPGGRPGRHGPRGPVAVPVDHVDRGLHRHRDRVAQRLAADRVGEVRATVDAGHPGQPDPEAALVEGEAERGDPRVGVPHHGEGVRWVHRRLAGVADRAEQVAPVLPDRYDDPHPTAGGDPAGERGHAVRVGADQRVPEQQRVGVGVSVHRDLETTRLRLHGTTVGSVPSGPCGRNPV
ncbi:AMP-binding protein [Nocardioides convexus]|uniref:AMP-binding protein n=1 Tax=Nocardioides convexus TaxID=2712224 RepID=UPI0024184AAE|nr:AMP-binding protein [Nocardioides convexus]